jgi:hypothetical protein
VSADRLRVLLFCVTDLAEGACVKSAHAGGLRLADFSADATFDPPAQRAPIDCKVGANGGGIDEAHGLGLATLDGGQSRKRALVVFVLVLIEPQPAAEADRGRELGLR